MSGQLRHEPRHGDYGRPFDKRDRPCGGKLENCAEDAGEQWYLLMTDKWFDDYVFQEVVTNKSFVDVRCTRFEGKSTMLPYYDPMGSLA